MNPELETYLKLLYGEFQIAADWFARLPEPVVSQLYHEYCRPTPIHGVSGIAAGQTKTYRIALAIYVWGATSERKDAARQRVYQLLAEYHGRT